MNLKKRFVAIIISSLLVSLPLPSYAQNAATATKRQSASSGQKLPAPTPLAGPGQPVDWLFIFKFNAATFDIGCAGEEIPATGSAGIFGGKVQHYEAKHSQQFAFATSAKPALDLGTGCVGATLTDPLGATFAQIYKTPGYHYVLWNDQFYNDPIKSEGGPYGHSKGMVAWNDDGEGLVLQVSTPSWPASGSQGHPRRVDGNTLGCINDDDIEVSQHFFALKLTKDDLVKVLKGLVNASVVTSIAHPEIVQTGGPAEIQAIVATIGKESKSTECTQVTLSTGVQMISKPSDMAAPPWQIVSAKLDKMPLRVASWWADPMIYTTNANTPIEAWPAGLGKPGAVEIATSGKCKWNNDKGIGLKGGMGTTFNHAKIGISTDKSKPICVFGDMNQQGALHKNYDHPGQSMKSSQNGRGGTFYVLKNEALFNSLADLLDGDTAPEQPPKGK